MVSVVAAEPSQILFLEVERVLHTCPDACRYHTRLIENLLRISARKNLNLSRRIFHTSAKTIRGRLLSFLSYRAAQSQEEWFTIPFNRQQLADYLGVDRSALSNELSKMQREGLLQVEKNQFRLLAGPCSLKRAGSSAWRREQDGIKRNRADTPARPIGGTYEQKGNCGAAPALSGG